MAIPGTYAFCTLITPPEGVTLDHLAHMLAGEGMSDVHSLMLHFARVPPMIIAQVDPALAARCAAMIVELGGDAMVTTMEQITRLGGTMRVRDIRVHPGNIEFELWRGPTAMVPTSRIDVLVRAHDSQTHTSAPKPLTRASASMQVIRSGAGLSNIREKMESQKPQTKLVTKDWLDIHTTDGSVYQVDGDKFGFQVLGDMRTQGDRHNMDRLFEMLTHLAPNAVGDTYFRQFKPPPGYKRLRLPEMRINMEDASFAFYSRWAAIVYRHVMGG